LDQIVDLDTDELYAVSMSVSVDNPAMGLGSSAWLDPFIIVAPGTNNRGAYSIQFSPGFNAPLPEPSSGGMLLAALMVLLGTAGTGACPTLSSRFRDQLPRIRRRHSTNLQLLNRCLG